MDSAAKNGHLEIVEFLHENRSEGCTSSAFKFAVLCSHLDVAQYLLNHRLEDCFEACIDSSANRGDLEVIKWLQTNYPDAECTVDVMDSAAGNSHLEVVQYLHKTRTEGCLTYAMDRAARNGHLDVVKWLHFHRTEGCTTDTMNHVDNLEILQWLGENRHEGFTRDALVNAVLHCDMGMLLCLCKRAPAEMWTSWLSVITMHNGRVEMLEWLAEHYLTLVDANALIPQCPSRCWSVLI